MVRQRRNYRRVVWTFPSDFPARLERLKEASSLSWRTLARQLGTEPRTLRRWRQGQPPSSIYLIALLCLARGIPDGLDTLLGPPAR